MQRIELQSRHAFRNERISLVVSYGWSAFVEQLENHRHMLNDHAYYTLVVDRVVAVLDVMLATIIGYGRARMAEEIAVLSQPSQENTVMSVARKAFLITVVRHKKDEDSEILFNATAVAVNEQHATLLAARKIPAEISDSDLARVEIVVKAL